MVTHLTGTVAEVRRTDRPYWGWTVEGYTCKQGGPTEYLIRLEGEKNFRRVMVYLFSNAGSAFVRIGGKAHFLTPDQEHQIDELKKKVA